MRKNYILDTNVLIHDPRSIFQFEDNYLYVPIYVIEELDKIKSELSMRGRNSREACRLIDELRCQGSISDGVPVGDGTFRVYVPTERKTISVALDSKSMDSAILQAALEIQEKTERRTILVTMDINLRIRAESLKIQTATYESQSVDPSQMATGHVTLQVSSADIDQMFDDGNIIPESKEELFDNACVTLVDYSNRTALGRYSRKTNQIKPIKLPKDILGIRPRNREQQFALDLLLDDSVKVVSLVGIAGTGKTLIASSVGLSKVLEGKYSRLLISRPIIPMGKDIGFLPGDINEKMSPWMQPIYDNIELLMMQGKKKGIKCEELFDQDLVRIEPLTYIRGRSISNQFLIVDECQNLNIHEIKTIITRCGEGSKVVLTGDPDQIDSPYLDKSTCGLNIAVEKLHDNSIVGHLVLSKGERSELANLAATLL